MRGCAAEHGFDGILVTPPPYMVPTDREILGFYREVNAAVSLPICVYNWPPGTNVDMSLDLLRSIAELSNVVAIKNSTADLRHFVDVFFALKDQVRVFGVPMNEVGHHAGAAARRGRHDGRGRGARPGAAGLLRCDLGERSAARAASWASATSC